VRAILAKGREELGWKRLLCPSYMCQPVAEGFALELPITAYPSSPLSLEPARVETEPGDVVIVIGSLGMRLDAIVSGPAVVIEDHTHDPLSEWASASSADYWVASLRKTLPLPDGGVLWSPRGHDLPPEQPMTAFHTQGTLERLEAMALKPLYMAGLAISKKVFRPLFMAGEDHVGNGPGISGISKFSRSRMATFPAHEWRARRSANLDALRNELGELDGVRLLDAPFAATLVFDEATHRDQVREYLIERRVYPAIYWPQEERVLPGVRQVDVDLSRRILSIQCDQRYTVDDMARVAGVVRAALGTS
jgi:hypothetical protein